MREMLREGFENFGKLRRGDTMMTKNIARAALKIFKGCPVPFRRDSGGLEAATRGGSVPHTHKARGQGFLHSLEYSGT